MNHIYTIKRRMCAKASATTDFGGIGRSVIQPLPRVIFTMALATSVAMGCGLAPEGNDSKDNNSSHRQALEVVKRWKNKNIGHFVITEPGIYQVEGTVTGNITVEPKSNGDIIIEGIGTNPLLHGIPWGGDTRRHVSHFSGAAKNGTLTWRNMRVYGDGHNAMEGNGSSRKVFENLHVKNFERTEGGKKYDNVGSINGGPNSVIKNCIIETGDDAAKLTEDDSSCFDTDIVLTRNGAAFQLGWGNRFGGADHIADNVSIRGGLAPNFYDDGRLRANDDDNPGRCIIGGIIQQNGSNVELTNLDIDVVSYKHLIKLVAQEGGVVSNVLIDGTVTDSSIFNQTEGGRTFYAVALTAKNNSRIDNMVVDMGKKIADPKFHWVSGNVDVKFLFGNGKVVEYIDGELVRNDHDGGNGGSNPGEDECTSIGECESAYPGLDVAACNQTNGVCRCWDGDVKVKCSKLAN